MSSPPPAPATSFPPPPAIAAALGPHRGSAQRYVDLLLTDAVQRGIIGPREQGRVWDRHFANSAALLPLLARGARVVDVGSGAGLPGIPLALLREDLDIVLLEPMQRRVDFLLECVAALGLDRVVVRRGRAPDDLGSDRETVVVARAVAPLAKLVNATQPVLAAGGSVLALKGQGAQREMDTVREQQLPVRLELLTPSFAGQRASVVRVQGAPGAQLSGRSSAARRRR